MAITKQPAQPILFPHPDHAVGVAYKVKDGDNWWTVAAAHKIDVKQLIHFNFKTNNPDEVNWYLREKVGCRVETPDRKNYRFSSSAVPGIIFIPISIPPAPPCPFDIRDAVAIEGRAAAGTRRLGGQVARRFVRTVGAIGRRGRFVPTVIDNKYWFAQLYDYVTMYEIAEARKFSEPAFVFHFIPIFYGMYHDALENWTIGRRSAVGELWTIHFKKAGRPDNSSIDSWMNGVMDSITTGAVAHIKGDMAIALERTYLSYISKYCLDPPPAFDEFRADFSGMGAVFQSARGLVLRKVAELGPFPGSLAGVGARYFGLKYPQVSGWRTAAWEEARRRLGQ